MASPNESKKLQTEKNDNTLEEQTPITPQDKQLSLFTKHMTTEEEATTPPSENTTTRRTKERVKEYLKPEFQIPEEELPDGIDKSSTYFNGAALNLPTGWLIELRPRTGGKQQDQFFYERGTGKQFRSLKDALKHLGSVSNQTAIDYPTKTVTYPWTEIMKKRSKRKRTIHHCQLFGAEENRWIPEVPNALRLPILIQIRLVEVDKDEDLNGESK